MHFKKLLRWIKHNWLGTAALLCLVSAIICDAAGSETGGIILGILAGFGLLVALFLATPKEIMWQETDYPTEELKPQLIELLRVFPAGTFLRIDGTHVYLLYHCDIKGIRPLLKSN
jgi:hypothetical protein